jgi:hypothetical protein
MPPKGTVPINWEVAKMSRRGLLVAGAAVLVTLALSIPAFSGNTLQFTANEVYFNSACSTGGYVVLCGKDKPDQWYVKATNTSDKTITAGKVSFVLTVQTKKGDQVLTGANLDFFRKVRISPDCCTCDAAALGVLPPHGCAFIGNVGGTDTLEWADVPVFDYKSMIGLGIIKAAVRINWSVSGVGGFSDSGSYTFYPPIIYK